MIPRRPFLTVLRGPFLVRSQSSGLPNFPGFPSPSSSESDVPPPPESENDIPPQPLSRSPLADISNLLQNASAGRSRSFLSISSLPAASGLDENYHLHIYSHKHNTHITFTRPDKSAVISLSCGNIGFRKSHRGTYDAAYQLAGHVFRLIEDKRIKPKGLEVVLRGFGQGRDAVTKALFGQEGRFLRPVIKRVTDSTRLKFGGTRSPGPRRLG